MTDESLACAYVEYLEAFTKRWSSAYAGKLVTVDLLAYLQPRFHRCSTPIKVRVLLSFLYLSDRVRTESQESLLRLLSEAEVDKDEWVRKLGRLVGSFVLVGAVDVRETDSETAFQILKFLNDQRTKHDLVYKQKPPLEAPHLANILTEKGGRDPPLKEHEYETMLNIDDFMKTYDPQPNQEDFCSRINFIQFNAGVLKEGSLSMKQACQKAFTK